MNSKGWMIVLICLSAQLLLLQHSHTQRLKDEIRLLQQARAIDNDELREALHHLAQARNEQRADDVKSFVAGVAAAVSNPGKYTEVWHAGYERGAAVQQYADQREREAKYASENSQK